MSRLSIGSLSYSVSADMSQLTTGVTLSRREMNTLRRTMEELKTPQDKLAEQTDTLARLHQAGKLSAEQYGRALELALSRTPEAIASADAEQRQHNDLLRDGKHFTELVATAEERRVATLARLDAALKRGVITEETYNRNRHMMRDTSAEDAALHRHNELMRQGKLFTDMARTAEERRVATLARLDELLKLAIIDETTYNRIKAKNGVIGDTVGEDLKANAIHRRHAIAQTLASRAPGGSFIAGVLTDLQAIGPAGAAAGAAIAGIGASIYVGRELTTAFLETAKQIDATSDQATALGMRFDELTLARRAFGELTGADSGTIDTSMQKMQVNLLEARQGTSDLAKELKTLGLDPDQLTRMAPVDAIKAIGAEFHKIQNPAEQIRFAMDLFGKSGAAMVAALRDGGEAIEDMDSHLARAGVTLNETQVNGIARMNDQLERANDYLTGFANQWTANIAPAVSSVLTMMEKMGSGQLAQMTASSALSRLAPVPYLDLAIRAVGAPEVAKAKEAAELNEQKREAAILAQREDETAKSILKSYESQREGLQKQLDERTRGKEIAMEEANIRAGMSAEQARELRQLQELIDEETRRKQIQDESRREAEQMQKRWEQQEQSALDRSISRVEDLNKKYTEGYELAERLAEIDDLRTQGLLSADQHSQFRDALSTEEAKKFKRASDVPTATKGSDEEYRLRKQAADRDTDKQILQLRKQEALAKAGNDELKAIRKAIESQKPVLIR
jgi:hypothetical protein